MSAAGALGSLLAYVRVLQGPRDVLTYARLRARYDRRGASAEPQTVRVRALGGMPLLVRPSQDVWTFKHTFVHGFHLPPQPVPDGGTIVDLGSNVGYTLAHLAYTYPRARVIGVEMDECNWRLAQRNTARFAGRVRVLHAAVWTHDGEVAYAGEGDDAFHVLDEHAPAGTRRAPARRLTSILDECALQTVDYLKMDIEGAEVALLAHAAEWASRIRSMKIELHPPATIDGARAALEPLGFRCHADTNHHHCLVASREGHGT